MGTEDNTPNMDDDGGFVMPEHDGVASGRPIEESSHDGIDALQSRLQGANTNPAAPQTQRMQETGSTRTQGLSIKNKLIGSYFILTIIIAGMGVFSYSTLTEVASINNLVSKDQSQIAKLAEEIKATTYKILGAEKDFIYLEEQEALDRVTRHSVQIRAQLEKITALAGQLATKTGQAIANEYQLIGELTDAYETLFANQVKDIKQARQALDHDTADFITFKKRLLDEVDKTLAIIDNLVVDHWIEAKKQLANQASSTADNLATVQIGVQLNHLQHELLNVQIQTAKYLDTKKQSSADLSRTYVNNSQVMANDIRIRGSDEKISQQMTAISKHLSAYTGIFNELTSTIETVLAEKKLINQNVKDQLAKLNDASEKLLAASNAVSARSWNQVNMLSNNLSESAESAQLSLLLLGITGTLVGIAVLLWIPRPVLEGINQLLRGAQQIAAGNLTTPVVVNSRDELGELASTFDRMRRNLQNLVIRSQSASIQITSAVNEIQAAANQQSATANQQAASISQFRATMGEMSRTANELAAVVNDINSYAEKVSEHVQVSNDKSIRLLESMSSISESTQQTSGRIKSLNDQMDTINDAVTVISGVADQTTLLSMNASIEANKAGEMGKGFSVVAYEIRRLSDRAIDSAGDITGKVRDIQRATENSVVAMDKSSEEIRLGIDQVQESTETLAGINESLNTIRSQVADITTGSQEQSVASGQAQQTAGELAESSRMVGQAAKQTVTAASEINVMANQLAESVAVFRT